MNRIDPELVLKRIDLSSPAGLLASVGRRAEGHVRERIPSCRQASLRACRRLHMRDVRATHRRRGQALRPRSRRGPLRSLRCLLFGGRAPQRLGVPGQSVSVEKGPGRPSITARTSAAVTLGRSMRVHLRSKLGAVVGIVGAGREPHVVEGQRLGVVGLGIAVGRRDLGPHLE